MAPRILSIQQKMMNRAWTIFWSMAAATLIMDQGSKLIALQNLDPQNPPPIIPGLFELRLVHNDGAAFSLFSGMRWFFILVSLLAVIFLPLYFRSLLRNGEDHLLSSIGLGLILGGALGNAFDRVFREEGLVVDFFHAYWGPYSFPVFNMADTAITIGLAAILWLSFFPPKRMTSLGREDERDVADTI